MKKLCKIMGLLALLFSGNSLSAQNNVGIGTNTPTEKLDVTGNIKTDTVKASGLQMTPNSGAGKVMVSDAIGNGSWQTSPTPTYTVGMNPALGGYVIAVTADGKHGIVCATQDQSLSSPWFLAQDVISDPGNHNANGQKYRDWRLPTKYELNLMYTQKVAIGGFGLGIYWSATFQGNSDYAWTQDFLSGIPNPLYVGTLLFVRAVRVF